MEHAGNQCEELLNPSQKNHFLTTLRHADQLLSDCEQILVSGDSRSPFPNYLPDFSEEERRALSGFIADLRQSFVSALSRLGMAVLAPHIRALHAIRTNLDYIDIDFEELRPNAMKGYGTLAEKASDRLETAVQDLQAKLRAMVGYLRARDSAP